MNVIVPVFWNPPPLSNTGNPVFTLSLNPFFTGTLKLMYCNVDAYWPLIQGFTDIGTSIVYVVSKPSHFIAAYNATQQYSAPGGLRGSSASHPHTTRFPVSFISSYPSVDPESGS